MARDAIKQSDFLMITAGAGMGVDSGLPDFRGQNGFWKAYPAFKKEGLTFPQVSNPTWFYKDPHMAWGFFGHRFNLYSSTTPHQGFQILKSWVQQKEHFIFTSNVDGQFAKAGFSEDRIVECHGSIHYAQCLDTFKCTLDIWRITSIKVNEETLKAEPPLPKCKNCGGMARPNILMFGDFGWIGDRNEEQMNRLNEKLGEKKWKIAIVELGAGEAVYTVRAFGKKLVDMERAQLVRINPDESHLSSTDSTIHLKMGALDGLTQLDKLMNE